jgi:hypothetical protein
VILLYRIRTSHGYGLKLILIKSRPEYSGRMAVDIMLAVLNRYKIFIIILMGVILAALLWMLISGLGKNKIPSRGVFVMQKLIENRISEGRRI